MVLNLARNVAASQSHVAAGHTSTRDWGGRTHRVSCDGGNAAGSTSRNKAGSECRLKKRAHVGQTILRTE